MLTTSVGRIEAAALTEAESRPRTESRFRIPSALNGFWSVPAVLGHTGSTGSWLFSCPEWDVDRAGTVDLVTAGAVPYRLVPRILRAIETAVGPD